MATKFPKKVDTSEPPQPERKNRTGNLYKPARHQDENEMVKKPLQFKVPETVLMNSHGERMKISVTRRERRSSCS